MSTLTASHAPHAAQRDLLCVHALRMLSITARQWGVVQGMVPAASAHTSTSTGAVSHCTVQRRWRTAA